MKFSISEVKINSMIIAIVLLSQTIAVTLSLGFGLTENANLVVLIAVFSLFMYEILKFGRILIRYRIEMAVLLVLIIALYGFSLAFSRYWIDYSAIQLVFYAILPILCMNLKFSVKLVCKYALYLSLFTVFGGDRFFEYQFSFMHQADMGNIYPIVTMLICSLFHFRYYRKDSDTRQFVKLCYVYNAYMLIRTCMVGNRGALLVLVFAMFVLALYDFDDKGSMMSLGSKQILIWSTICGVLIVVVLNMELIFNLLEVIFDGLFGYVPSVILKMQRYIGFEDVSNGRGPIYDIVFSAIKDSPVYGHGIETFSGYTSGAYPYPHNFILQFIYEGGILFSAIPLVLAIVLPIRVILGKIKDKSLYIISAILVCQCYPKLLLSSDCWQGTALWMMIMWAWICLKLQKRGNRMVGAAYE